MHESHQQSAIGFHQFVRHLHPRNCAACDMAGHDLVHAGQPRLGRSPSLGHWHRRVEERRDYRKQQIGAVHNRHVRSAGEHREL